VVATADVRNLIHSFVIHSVVATRKSTQTSSGGCYFVIIHGLLNGILISANVLLTINQSSIFIFCTSYIILEKTTPEDLLSNMRYSYLYVIPNMHYALSRTQLLCEPSTSLV